MKRENKIPVNIFEDTDFNALVNDFSNNKIGKKPLGLFKKDPKKKNCVRTKAAL